MSFDAIRAILKSSAAFIVYSEKGCGHKMISSFWDKLTRQLSSASLEIDLELHSCHGGGLTRCFTYPGTAHPAIHPAARMIFSLPSSAAFWFQAANEQAVPLARYLLSESPINTEGIAALGEPFRYCQIRSLRSFPRGQHSSLCGNHY